MAKKTHANRKNSRGQRILSYPAVFDLDEGGIFNVSFPDFPGCVTFGRTFEEAREKAREALGLWLEELQIDRLPVPIKTPVVQSLMISRSRSRVD